MAGGVKWWHWAGAGVLLYLFYPRRFGKPLPDAHVSGGWGDPRPASVGHYHYAIDLPAPTGTPIYSAQGGTVVAADAVGGTSAGKYVVVKQGETATRYLHMSQVMVTKGDRVSRGTLLGLVGSTGLSAGPHLHLDVFLSGAKLAAFKKRYGTPNPPYPSPRQWGTQVPAETLIPVDSYAARVRSAAAERGVTLLG